MHKIYNIKFVKKYRKLIHKKVILKIVCFLLIDFVNEVVLLENTGHYMNSRKILIVNKIRTSFQRVEQLVEHHACLYQKCLLVLSS